MLRALKRFKLIGWLLIVFMIWSYGGGRINADNYAASANRVAPIANPESRFDALLAELKDVVKGGGDKTKAAPEKGFQDIPKLAGLKQSLIEENEKVQNYFTQLERLIKQKKLPAEILNRHVDFVRQYEAKYEALMENVKGVESAHQDTTGLWAKLTGKNKKVDWDAVIGKTLSFLEENTPRPRESHFDPNNLPHRSLKADKAIPPKLSREEWLKAFAKESSVGAGQVSQSSAVKAQGSITLAATAQPTPADLAETIEVKFTPEIRQLADSLGKNPVKIFNWVRNQIEFVPTWGSIQGAQLCMENRAGNAFDTASLLIALLRYSGIPARYQMGTIEVPVERFKNWAGGFTNAEAAASLFASAGVPSVVRRVDQSGQVGTVKLEHAWVEAFVDYAPSSGAVHSSGDTWVRMDASFKQHIFVAGIDSSQALNLDGNTLLDQLKASATIDPVTGSVTRLSSTLIQNQSAEVESRLDSFITANFNNPRVLDIIGGSVTNKQEFSLLPATLPYRVLITGQSLSAIPDSLRHKLTLEFPDVGGAGITTGKSLPELAGKRLTLSYAPATSTDAETLTSFAQAGLVSIPAHSVQVKPELRINGELISTGQALRLGQPQTFVMTLSAPNLSPNRISNDIVAGTYNAIVLSLGRVTPDRATRMANQVKAIQAKVETGDLTGLINDDIWGTLLDAIGTGFWAQVDNFDLVSARANGVVSTPLPSEGIFSVNLAVSFLFGVPFSVRISGFGTDIDASLQVNEAKDGDRRKAAEYTRQSGIYGSFWEGAIYSLFIRPAPGLEIGGGVSTAQLLAKANKLGIPVYQIDASNIGDILPKLQVLSDVRTDIQDAVAAGQVVIIPEREMTIGQFTGIGYIVNDPITGSGAYLITGGTNGALFLASGVLLIAAGLLEILFGGPVLQFIGPLLLALGIFLVGLGLTLITGNSVWLRVGISGALAIINIYLFFISAALGFGGAAIPIFVTVLIWLFRTASFINTVCGALNFFGIPCPPELSAAGTGIQARPWYLKERENKVARETRPVLGIGGWRITYEFM